MNTNIKIEEKQELINGVELRRIVLDARAINHKLRKKIMNLLIERESMTVTDIYIQLRTEQSIASQHLAILRRALFVNTQRQGKFIYYTANNERIEQFQKLINTNFKYVRNIK